MGRLLSAGDVADMIGVHVATIRGWVAAGRLPAPIRLSRKCVRWRAAVIEAWLRSGGHAE